MTLLLPANVPVPTRRFLGVRRIAKAEDSVIATEPPLGNGINHIWCADVMDFLRSLPDNHVNCVVTSPPYFGLRAYLPDGHPDKEREIGSEPKPEEFVATMVAVFGEVRRVLRDDGVCFLNLGDSYWNSTFIRPSSGGAFLNKGDEGYGEFYAVNGGGVSGGKRRSTKHETLKEKDLMLIPFRVAIALQREGWYVRGDAPWLKRNVMPESVRDRFTKAHEYVFHLTKSEHYWFDQEAIRKSAAPSSIERISQPNFENQTGGPKDYGKTGVNRNRSARKAIESFAANPGRNYRSSDAWFDGLDAQIDALRSELNYLVNLRDNGGVLVGDDTIDAFVINPKSYDGAHFATFPAGLVEPIILVGCPDKVCSICGEPWKRIVEHGEPVRIGGKGGNSISSAVDPMDRGGKGQWDKGHMPMSRPKETIGFEPTCTCCAEPRPGICLDPFMGSGTTALVARNLGRSFIGADLNPDYVKMARSRISNSDPLESTVLTPEIEQLSLFQQVASK